MCIIKLHIRNTRHPLGKGSVCRTSIIRTTNCFCQRFGIRRARARWFRIFYCSNPTSPYGMLLYLLWMMRNLRNGWSLLFNIPHSLQFKDDFSLNTFFWDAFAVLHFVMQQHPPSQVVRVIEILHTSSCLCAKALASKIASSTHTRICKFSVWYPKRKRDD